MIESFREHWQEYLIEAWGLGTFMVSACFFATLLFYPHSPFYSSDKFLLNVLMGLAMGLTATGIILSPWGKRSGAHINPAVTLTFFRLGKINIQDTVFYILFQFIGGTSGVLVSWFVLGKRLESSSVNFAVTVPGALGVTAAFIAEFIISFLLMMMVLVTTNSEKLMRYTGYLAGIFVALFIAFEVQYSGMSMNPARTFASAVVANNWLSWWVYIVSPISAMFLAAELYVRLKSHDQVKCAKLDHDNKQRCIFCEKPEGTHYQNENNLSGNSI